MSRNVDCAFYDQKQSPGGALKKNCVLKSFIKKETLTQTCSCEFCEIFKNTFFIEHLRWLLLYDP